MKEFQSFYKLFEGVLKPDGNDEEGNIILKYKGGAKSGRNTKEK